MALVSLLKMPDSARARAGFTFDHDMEHRAIAQSLLTPDAPYLLDPISPTDTTTRAGNWQQNHQRAHNNLAINFPINPFNQNMMDSNLSKPESLTWWTFLNHQEHYIATRLA